MALLEEVASRMGKRQLLLHRSLEGCGMRGWTFSGQRNVAQRKNGIELYCRQLDEISFQASRKISYSQLLLSEFFLFLTASLCRNNFHRYQIVLFSPDWLH